MLSIIFAGILLFKAGFGSTACLLQSVKYSFTKKVDMWTNVLLLLRKAVRKDDFITARQLLEEHWETLSVLSENSKCRLTLSILRYYCNAMLRYLKALPQDPPKKKIWDILLCISCLRGDVQLAKLLLNKGASVTWKLNDDSSTCLHVAVYENHPKIVHLLLQTDPACANIKDDRDTPVLHLAANEERTEIVDLLLEYGADVKLVDHYGYTVLHNACESGRQHIVQRLLKHSGTSINIRSGRGSTALRVAAEKDNLNIVKLLLNSNEIADVYDQHKGHSLKTCANQEPVEWGNTDNILIERLIKLKEQGDLCVTPLDILACRICCEKMEQLKATAADVNLMDIDEETPLQHAIQHENLEMVQLLLKHGAHYTQNEETGCVPLEILLMYGEYFNFFQVPDCVRNLFLKDEVAVELFEYFMVDTVYDYGGSAEVINRLFVENRYLVGLFMCCGIRVKYLNDKYGNVGLPAKIYYFVRWCVAWLEKEEVRFVKVDANGEYVMELFYNRNLHRRLKDSFLEKYIGKSPMELLDDCVKETEVMKSRRLGETGLTLFNVIEADLDRLVKYLGNIELLYALKRESDFSEFPICGEILGAQIDRGLTRRLLIDRCVQYFPSAYPDCSTLVLKILEPTFHTLSNRDLYAFSFACSSLV